MHIKDIFKIPTRPELLIKKCILLNMLIATDSNRLTMIVTAVKRVIVQMLSVPPKLISTITLN